MSEVKGSDCMIGIWRGEVRCAVACDHGKTTADAIAEWSADPDITEIVRVPVEIARAFLFEKWPGREAALASLGRSALAPDNQEARRGT